MRGGGNDETVSTGCGPPSVLHILDVTVTYARDSFVDSPAGPFVLSRGGPDILAPGLQGVPLEDICVAAGWSSPYTFVRFYNLDFDTAPGSQILSV